MPARSWRSAAFTASTGATSRWLPWFDVGKPIEYAYQPLLPALTALLNWLSPWSIARCYEIVLATFYCLGPVALFWFAWEWSASLRLSFLAGLTYSLLSPSPMFIPVIRVQPAGIWAAQRLYNLVYYGEGPHNVAITLLPVGLLFLHRAMVRRDPRSIAGAIVSCAAVVLSNAFGAVGLGIGALCIALALRRGFGIAAVMALAAWLWASPFLPPALIATIARNAWTARGSYHAGIGAYGRGGASRADLRTRLVRHEALLNPPSNVSSCSSRPGCF